MLTISTQDEKTRLEEGKAQLLQTQAKAEAAESSIRQEYNQLRSEKVYFLVTMMSISLTWIS